MSNIFGNIDTSGMEQSKDSLGGFSLLDSDVYAGEIKLAFVGAADSGARSLTVHVALDSGQEYRETVYFTSGTEKGGNPYYVRDGKKIPLPGFTTANDLALLSTGFELLKQDAEEKVVKLYNKEAGGEIPTKVMALTGMHGKRVKLGIVKNIEDKTAKNAATGQYEPTGETRETNNIDKVFHAESNKTVSEFTSGAEAAEFHDKWLDKNKGQVRNRAKGVAGKTGVPGQGAPTGAPAGTPGKSLFG